MFVNGLSVGFIILEVIRIDRIKKTTKIERVNQNEKENLSQYITILSSILKIPTNYAPIIVITIAVLVSIKRINS